jgi:hypothetical protein
VRLSGATSSAENNLFRSRDVNAPLPPFYTARPNPAFGQIRQIESSANLAAHSLEVSFRGSIGRYFSGMAQYLLSRAYNDVGGARTINSFPANNWDLTGEWARADYDARHRLNLLESVTPGMRFNVGVALEDAFLPASILQAINRTLAAGLYPGVGVRRLSERFSVGRSS